MIRTVLIPHPGRANKQPLRMHLDLQEEEEDKQFLAADGLPGLTVAHRGQSSEDLLHSDIQH